ncbi:hypothetical protein SELMODRAFT_437383 [Selaginella moellendorffii]|uniref:Uncharacterized protein GLT1-2 n=1 Tax=Selaginella moellendorffii TaxID=88036 RepID=D8QQI7_SELML|nr:hypothetical protein SELMODRAFT_437383 [Selaginella moellendorffii]
MATLCTLALHSKALVSSPSLFSSRNLTGFRSRRRSFGAVPNAKIGEEDKTLSSKQEDVSKTTKPESSIDLGDPDFGWVPVLPHVLTAAMANFMFGYHIGVINGPLESIARELGFDGDTIMQGFVVSIFIVGAFAGSVSGGVLADKIGRRRTFQLDMIPLVLGPAISANAHTVNEMLIGRALVGLGIGINTSLVPLYISEISPTKYRGALCSLCQIGTCTGIIVSLLLGIPAQTDPHWWREMFWIGSVPAALLIVAMQFAVLKNFSQGVSIQNGQWEEALSTIKKLWGEAEVEQAIQELKRSSDVDGEKDQASWGELLLAQNRKVALIGGSLFFLQQFAGINGVLYFSSSTFHDAGISDGLTASVAVGVVNFAGALVASSLMDKQGRRKLLMISYTGMAISMAVLVVALEAPMDDSIAHLLSVIGTLTYMFTFALGAGPVTGIIIPELCTTRSRAKIMAFSLCVHWVSNFFIGLFFLTAIQAFGLPAVYTGFGAVSLATVAFANSFIIETKGKSLEEIQLLINPD